MSSETFIILSHFSPTHKMSLSVSSPGILHRERERHSVWVLEAVFPASATETIYLSCLIWKLIHSFQLAYP